MTTERERLVEQVAESVEPLLYGRLLDPYAIATAAIAAYEASAERTAISLADKYSARIANLERELCEAKQANPVTYTIKVPEELAKLEAEAAAMRGALEQVLNGITFPDYAPDNYQLVISTTNGGIVDVSKSLTVGTLRAARAALSPEAGQRVLAALGGEHDGR